MSQRRKPRFIYNDDSCTLRTAPPPHTVDSIACALDYLKGTQVDCLCWCIGMQIAYAWPSKVIENIYDLKAARPTRQAGWHDERDVMLSLHRQGIDYLPHLIRRAHDQGLTFVASFRMNDTHHKSDPGSNLSPSFWKAHQHYRLWEVTDAKSYYNAALDYSFPEVRSRYRDAIAEVLELYDVDGVELDFTRSPYFFQPSEAWDKRDILTQFVRDIRDLMERIGTHRERPLMLILRVASFGRALTTAGIDLERWIKERLASILVIGELFHHCNQVIEPWRSLCRKAGVLLYPAVESGPAYNRTDFYSPLLRNPLVPRHDGCAGPFTDHQKIAMQRAAAQNLLAQDPDGIYLFNFPCRLAEKRNILHTDPTALKQITSVLTELGSLETLAHRDKLYTYYRDLPIYVEASRPRRYHQTIAFTMRGADIRDTSVTLSWRWIAERNPHAEGKYRQNPMVKPRLIKVYLNDREIPESDLAKTKAPRGRIPSGFMLKTHEIVELQVSGRDLHDGENTLAFEMPKFPDARDPYVYVYEFQTHVHFG